MTDEQKDDVTGIYIDKFAALTTSAFGLVAALAWNDAIKAIIKEIFGTPDAVAPMLTYAAVITVLAVFATHWIGRLSERAKSLT